MVFLDFVQEIRSGTRWCNMATKPALVVSRLQCLFQECYRCLCPLAFRALHLLCSFGPDLACISFSSVQWGEASFVAKSLSPFRVFVWVSTFHLHRLKLTWWPYWKDEVCGTIGSLSKSVPDDICGTLPTLLSVCCWLLLFCPRNRALSPFAKTSILMLSTVIYFTLTLYWLWIFSFCPGCIPSPTASGQILWSCGDTDVIFPAHPTDWCKCSSSEKHKTPPNVGFECSRSHAKTESWNNPYRHCWAALHHMTIWAVATCVMNVAKFIAPLVCCRLVSILWQIVPIYWQTTECEVDQLVPNSSIWIYYLRANFCQFTFVLHFFRFNLVIVPTRTGNLVQFLCSFVRQITEPLHAFSGMSFHACRRTTLQFVDEAFPILVIFWLLQQ